MSMFLRCPDESERAKVFVLMSRMSADWHTTEDMHTLIP